MSLLTEKEQSIYLKMGKGCPKKVRRIKDPIDKIYIGQICLKENDNDVSCIMNINSLVLRILDLRLIFFL